RADDENDRVDERDAEGAVRDQPDEIAEAEPLLRPADIEKPPFVEAEDQRAGQRKEDERRDGQDGGRGHQETEQAPLIVARPGSAYRHASPGRGLGGARHKRHLPRTSLSMVTRPLAASSGVFLPSITSCTAISIL